MGFPGAAQTAPPRIGATPEESPVATADIDLGLTSPSRSKGGMTAVERDDFLNQIEEMRAELANLKSAKVSTSTNTSDAHFRRISALIFGAF